MNVNPEKILKIVGCGVFEWPVLGNEHEGWTLLENEAGRESVPMASYATVDELLAAMITLLVLEAAMFLEAEKGVVWTS